MLILLACATAIFSSVAGLLSQVFIWQVKEYRWDRMKARMTSPEGSPQKYPIYLASLVLLLGSLGLLSMTPMFSVLLAWASLMLLAVHHMVRMYTSGVLRPDLTQKSALVLTVSAGLLIPGFYWALYASNSLQPVLFALAAHLVLPVVAVSVGLVNIPATAKKQSVIRRAAALRESLTDLDVIGITGSVGKTSTKFFLEHILRSAGKTVRATKEHRNAEYPVAQDMLEQLNSSVDTYVAEMGAYRANEIQLLAQLAKPTVGTITHIGNQHMALFGSKEGILAAKWELIDALPDGGIAVLHADDSLLRKKAQASPKQITWFSATQSADVYVDNVEFGARKTKATLHIQEESIDVALPLVSDGLLKSAVAAAATAYAVGVGTDAIGKAMRTLVPYPRTMEIRDGKDGSTIIDDSYSASEDSVRNAVDHLQRFSEKDKRIVLVPIIELGAEGVSAHQRLAKHMAGSGAQIYIYGDAYQEVFAAELDGTSWHVVKDAKELARRVSEGVTQDSVILLEGRVPAVVREAVL